MIIDPILIPALLAGWAIALAAAPLGCIVVWRRMAYFGDATAHAAVLGVALAMLFSVPILLGVLVIALGMAMIMGGAPRGNRLASDTMLGVFAHGALALGLVTASLLPGIRINVLETLLGDLLAISYRDVAMIWGGAICIVAVMAWRWRSIVSATLSPELMVAEGGAGKRDQVIFAVTLALFVALSIKLVGVLLITAMLILPAAAARPLSRTPEQMAVTAGLLGMVSVAGGLFLAWNYDTPAGPSIIVASVLLFALTTTFRSFR